MFSWEFFIGFIVLGLFLRALGPKKGVLAILIIAIGWGFLYGAWAIATFIELIIGFSIANSILSDPEERKKHDGWMHQQELEKQEAERKKHDAWIRQQESEKRKKENEGCLVATFYVVLALVVLVASIQ